MSLIGVLCAWNAIDDFRLAASMRQTRAKVVDAKLTIDWGRAEVDSYEEPLYELVLDFVATDGSGRTFHWEGDPDQAIYPEEAIDALSLFAVGSEHTVSTLRGNARALRLEGFESSPEMGKGFGWTFGAVFAGIIALAAFASSSLDGDGPVGPWMVFVGFGIVPLLGSIPLGIIGFQKVTSWRQVTATVAKQEAPFDVAQLPPRVLVTAKAKENLPQHAYLRMEFEWNGKRLHAGKGRWHGPYDRVGEKFYVSPTDRWAVQENLSWGEDFFLPAGIVAFFGIAFTGAGFVIRSQFSSGAGGARLRSPFAELRGRLRPTPHKPRRP